MKKLFSSLLIVAIFLSTTPLKVQAALDTNLVSCWKLDEASGSASDSKASNTLTNNNTVVYAAGKINNAADFETGTVSQSLSITDASQSGLDITGDISIAFWWKPESQNTEQYFVSKFKLSSRQYRAGYDGGGSLSWTYSDDGTGNVGHQENITKAITITNGTFYLIVFTYKSSTKTATFYQNATSLGTGAGGTATTIFNGTADFQIGNYEGGLLNQGTDGLMDEVGIWSRELTQADVTALYNGGTGLACNFASAAAVTPPSFIMFQ